jgi:hypothetical protein
MTSRITDLAQADYDLFERMAVGILREARPDMDLRLGTALRDLLVRPGAQLMAAVSKDVAALDGALRIGGSADEGIARSVLSNYNVALRYGARAAGQAAVALSRPVDYLLGVNFHLLAGQSKYVVDRQWRIVAGAVSDPARELRVESAADGAYYVIIPVTASEEGSAHNRESGEALEFGVSTPMEFTSASAYGALSGGEDAEGVLPARAALPSAMAHTGLSSAASVRAALMSKFDFIRGVSVVGAGDPAMLRDRRNPFGFSSGGRVDVYVRTHTAPVSVSATLPGRRVRDGEYTIRVPASAAPGYYRIKSVTSPASRLTAASGPVVGSYLFRETRKSEGIQLSGHDAGEFDSFQTVWQAAEVVVSGVGAVIAGARALYPDELMFLVEFQAPRRLLDIQRHVDDPEAQRSLEADFIVRGGVPCFVSVKADVRRRAESKADAKAMSLAIAAHVNALDFGAELSVSQLSSVLHGFDIESASFGGDGLSVSHMDARVMGAGRTLRLRSPDLAPADMMDPGALITPATVMLVCDPADVFLREVLV